MLGITLKRFLQQGICGHIHVVCEAPGLSLRPRGPWKGHFDMSISFTQVHQREKTNPTADVGF